MVRYLLLTLLFIWLFRIVLRYVIPILKITSGVRRQMRHMQQGPGQAQSVPPQSRPQQSRKGDYIDYEEIK